MFAIIELADGTTHHDALPTRTTMTDAETKCRRAMASDPEIASINLVLVHVVGGRAGVRLTRGEGFITASPYNDATCPFCGVRN